MKRSSALRRSLALSLVTALLAGPAAAQDVRIVAKDGSLDIFGRLLSAENGILKVATPIGELTMEQAKVTCEGAACPQPVVFDYAFSLAAPAEVAEVLVPILFDGFASDNDAEVVLLDETGYEVAEEDFALAIREGAKVPLQMIDYDGEELANFGVQETAGAAAFDLLAAGEVALAFTEAPAGPADIQRVAQAGAGNLESFEQEHVVAVDGLAVIAHPDNPLPAISVADVAAVFAGRITNWARVGGPDAPITVYSFAPGSEANKDTETILLDRFGVSQTPAARIMTSAREMTAAVTSDPNGIAVVGYHGKRGARALPLANECGMVVPASPFTIKTEEYPLQKRIVAYSRNDVDGMAREFLDHLDSSALDGLVSKAGFIDLSVVPEGEEYASQRLETVLAAPLGVGEQQVSSLMFTEMERSQRLSTTFRFAPGSSILDNRARRDLNRMVDFIQREKPGTVYIVGFADSAGAFSENQRLSENRARQVADQIAAEAGAGGLDGVQIEIRGYSELAPVACNENFEGRAINRRVEVWVE